jgi:hypothetical protein
MQLDTDPQRTGISSHRHAEHPIYRRRHAIGHFFDDRLRRFVV